MHELITKNSFQLKQPYHLKQIKHISVIQCKLGGLNDDGMESFNCTTQPTLSTNISLENV